MQTRNSSTETPSAQATAWTGRYLELFPEETPRISKLCAQLEDPSSAVFHRKTLPGHITASGIVVSDRKILMIHHPFLNCWLQPGGHVEEGETPQEAALREVLEETGSRCALHAWHTRQPIPFDIDVHSIPENPKKGEPQHFHYDFRFLLTSLGAGESAEEDIHAWAWRPVGDIEEPNLRQLVEKMAQQKLL
jgi:8-oxo-dGTP pyrophosphatase MutT (NUDIX family)